LRTIGRDKAWLKKYLRKEKLSAPDVFLMLADDADGITIIKKENSKK